MLGPTFKATAFATGIRRATEMRRTLKEGFRGWQKEGPAGKSETGQALSQPLYWFPDREGGVGTRAWKIS